MILFILIPHTCSRFRRYELLLMVGSSQRSENGLHVDLPQLYSAALQ